MTADASASAAGSSPISSYTFNFGDGTTAGPQASPTATHTYSSAGSYTVTVTATDGNNLTSQAGQGVTVTAPRRPGRPRHWPSAQLRHGAAGGDRGCVRLGGGQLADQLLYLQFGDGTTAGPQASPTATHTYSSAGSYTVTVTATDGNNLTSQAGQGVTVTAPRRPGRPRHCRSARLGDGAAGGDRGCVRLGGGQLADQLLYLQFR